MYVVEPEAFVVSCSAPVVLSISTTRLASVMLVQVTVHDIEIDVDVALVTDMLVETLPIAIFKS